MKGLLFISTVLFFLVMSSQLAYAQSVSELKKLVFSAVRFDEPLKLEIGESDDWSEVSRVRETAKAAIRVLCAKGDTGWGPQWKWLPRSKWATGQGHFERRGTAAGGAILPSEKVYRFDPLITFFAENGFVEIIRLDFPIGCNNRREIETKDFYLVFYTDKLKPYIKERKGEKNIIHVGKRKLKSILHEHKTKESYYFEFSYMLEPTFPHLTNLGPYYGEGTCLYNNFTGRWNCEGGLFPKEDFEMRKRGQWANRTEYGGREFEFWINNAYKGKSPPISRRISALGDSETKASPLIPVPKPSEPTKTEPQLEQKAAPSYRYEINRSLNYNLKGWNVMLESVEILDNGTMALYFSTTNNTGKSIGAWVPKDYDSSVYLTDNLGNRYSLIEFKGITKEPKKTMVSHGKTIHYSYIFPAFKEGVSSFSFTEGEFGFRNIELKPKSELPELTGSPDEDMGKLKAFIADQWRLIIQIPPPKRDWRELVILKITGKYDTYSELYDNTHKEGRTFKIHFFNAVG